MAANFAKLNVPIVTKIMYGMIVHLKMASTMGNCGAVGIAKVRSSDTTVGKAAGVKSSRNGKMAVL